MSTINNKKQVMKYDAKPDSEALESIEKTRNAHDIHMLIGKHFIALGWWKDYVMMYTKSHTFAEKKNCSGVIEYWPGNFVTTYQVILEYYNDVATLVKEEILFGFSIAGVTVKHTLTKDSYPPESFDQQFTFSQGCEKFLTFIYTAARPFNKAYERSAPL
jgi:hypothetical protein